MSAVAERDGVPVGVCLVSVKTQAKGQTILTERSIACVEALCVAQSCRGQGIGTSRMRWLGSGAGGGAWAGRRGMIGLRLPRFRPVAV